MRQWLYKHDRWLGIRSSITRSIWRLLHGFIFEAHDRPDLMSSIGSEPFVFSSYGHVESPILSQDMLENPRLYSI